MKEGQVFERKQSKQQTNGKTTIPITTLEKATTLILMMVGMVTRRESH